MTTIPKGTHVRVYRHPVGDPPQKQSALDGILTANYAFGDAVTLLVDGEEQYVYNNLDRVEIREGTPRRDWMTIAKTGVLRDQRERIELMIERLKWQEHPLPDTLPMSPGLAIKKVIAEFKVPKVSSIAIATDDLIMPDPTIDRDELPDVIGDGISIPDGDGDRAYLALYGIEGNYKNGRVRLYVVDFGSHLNVVAADAYEPVEA